MAGPDLHESAWQRAKTDAGAVYRTTYFGLALAIVELLAVPAAVLFTADPDTSTTTQVAVPILSGVVALVVAFVSVLIAQLIAAPVRQRDELRRGWQSDPTAQDAVRSALRTIGADLTALERRLEETVATGGYEMGFHLNTRWEGENQQVLSSAPGLGETYAKVAAAYGEIDRINRVVELHRARSGVPNPEPSIQGEDGVDAVISAINNAESAVGSALADRN